MTLNDHLALTEERRNEIDSLLLSIAFGGEDEHIPASEKNQALFDLNTHIKAQDERVANWARIFGKLEKAADALAADDTNAQAKGLGLALQRLLIDSLTPSKEDEND